MAIGSRAQRSADVPVFGLCPASVGGRGLRWLSLFGAMLAFGHVMGTLTGFAMASRFNIEYFLLFRAQLRVEGFCGFVAGVHVRRHLCMAFLPGFDALWHRQLGHGLVLGLEVRAVWRSGRHHGSEVLIPGTLLGCRQVQLLLQRGGALGRVMGTLALFCAMPCRAMLPGSAGLRTSGRLNWLG